MSELLVIDDCAAKIAERIAKNRVLSKEFVPDAVELTWREDIAVELSRELKRRQDAGKLYDLALLGLRFGEPEGYDLSGYHLMAHIRRFFPKTPIVIYSRHDDMRELARAFRNGASWFLRKDELNRLPEVFAAVNTPRPWEPEWRTIRAAGMVKAAGVKQSIISALRQDLLDGVTKALGVAPYMECVYGTDNLDGASKLDRALELMTKLVSTAEEGDRFLSNVVMIGDALHDKEVADALGVRCVLCGQGSHASWRLRKVAPTGETLLEAVDLALLTA